MLKKGIIFLLVFVLAQLVYAEQEIVGIALVKEQYSAGETVQMRLTTEPLEKPLKPEQLAVYVNGIKKSIAPFFIRYNENMYLLYFDLPAVIDGPVYFKVDRILYKGSAGLQEYTVEKEIPINSEPDSILSIVPAFVVLEKNQREFQIQVENKLGGTTFNVTASSSIAHPYTVLQTISPDTKRIFRFTVDLNKLEGDAAVQIDHEGTFYNISVLKKQQVIEVRQNETRQVINKLIFIATNPEVRKSITPDIILSGVLSLKNEGNLTLENIQIGFIGTIGKIASTDTTLIPSLNDGQSVDMVIKINEQQIAQPGVYEGVLQAESGAMKAVFPLFVEIKATENEQLGNKTEIDLGLKGSGRELPDDKGNLNINLSKQEQQQTPKEYPLGLILITLVILLSVIGLYFLKKKKNVEEETFDDYIKKIRK